MKTIGKPISRTKSIEICALQAGEVVQISEHPLTLDESKASVSYVQDKISTAAFSGAGVKLLDAKNVLIADVEGITGGSMIMISIPLCISIIYYNNQISRCMNVVVCMLLPLPPNSYSRL